MSSNRMDANTNRANGALYERHQYIVMILEALRILNDRRGATENSIAKFTNKNYGNLPPNHSYLLSTYLNIMRGKDILTMRGNSYKRIIGLPDENLNTYPHTVELITKERIFYRTFADPIHETFIETVVYSK